MNPLKKIYCRTYQFAFRMAIPFLPYREPEIFESIADLEPLLHSLHVTSVLLVTDPFLRSSGATLSLEHLLEENGIHCAVYDKTWTNPTVLNKEANPLYPVPKLMDASQLERFYYQVTDRR